MRAAGVPMLRSVLTQSYFPKVFSTPRPLASLKGRKQVLWALECHQCLPNRRGHSLPPPQHTLGKLCTCGNNLLISLILKLPTTQWHFALIAGTPKNVLEGLAGSQTCVFLRQLTQWSAVGVQRKPRG